MIDINLTSYLSSLEVDKTIAVFKGSLSIPAGGNNSVDHALPIGAGHTFWEGTYTVGSSTQQNDIGGMQYSGLTGVGLEARSFVGGIRVRGVNNTGSSVIANYNLSVIASPETGTIPAIGTFPAMDNPIAFDSRENHRKIIKTRAFNPSSDGQGWVGSGGNVNAWKCVFRGDGDVLSVSNRIKVYVVLDDGFMYDMSTHYGRTQVAIAGGEVMATIRTDVIGGITPPNVVAYIRYYYE